MVLGGGRGAWETEAPEPGGLSRDRTGKEVGLSPAAREPRCASEPSHGARPNLVSDCVSTSLCGASRGNSNLRGATPPFKGGKSNSLNPSVL